MVTNAYFKVGTLLVVLHTYMEGVATISLILKLLVERPMA